MNAVITVVGIDQVGILAKVSTACAENQVNIVDVAQTVMDNYFTMTMLVTVDEGQVAFDDFQESVENLIPGMQITLMHEDIFKAMHRL
ncbi:ACT domain-containing protein [Aerococcus urinae]|uniref:ACT domain-containing protein n=1 Tax=Aerococcus urinae TaxID=1376 RepID=UPI000DCEFE6E|nr:ACT domain-containing protein [Aerococcus urinae]RAV67760.1 ACT domain-containing protein [Aerococcus urinae]